MCFLIWYIFLFAFRELITKSQIKEAHSQGKSQLQGLSIDRLCLDVSIYSQTDIQFVFIVNSTVLDNIWGGSWGSFDFSVVFLPFKCLKKSFLVSKKLLVCILHGFVSFLQKKIVVFFFLSNASNTFQKNFKIWT